MIVLEATYELVHQTHEVKFLKSLKDHLRNVKSLFHDVIEPVGFNVGNAPFGAFVIQFHFNSESEELFSKFEKKLPELINADFSPELSSALKTKFRVLMPWSDFLL